MKAALPILVATALGLSGCASTLQVWKASDTAENKTYLGVPFRTMEAFQVTGRYTKHEEGPCTETPFSLIEILPTGETYYANVKTADFAKTEFSVSVTDKGTLESVSMNSEPASEAIDSVTAALTSLGAVVGARAETEGQAEASGKTTTTTEERLCNSGPVGVDYKKPGSP